MPQQEESLGGGARVSICLRFWWGAGCPKKTRLFGGGEVTTVTEIGGGGGLPQMVM